MKTPRTTSSSTKTWRMKRGNLPMKRISSVLNTYNEQDYKEFYYTFYWKTGTLDAILSLHNPDKQKTIEYNYFCSGSNDCPEIVRHLGFEHSTKTDIGVTINEEKKINVEDINIDNIRSFKNGKIIDETNNSIKIEVSKIRDFKCFFNLNSFEYTEGEDNEYGYNYGYYPSQIASTYSATDIYKMGDMYEYNEKLYSLSNLVREIEKKRSREI